MEIREVENNFNCTASPYPTNIMSVILLPQVKMGVQINKQQQKLSMNQKDQKDQNKSNIQNLFDFLITYPLLLSF